MAAATSLAIAGIAVSAGSAGMSFYNASESKKLQAQAQADAAEAMKNARKGLSANFYESIGIPKETYELQSEAALSAGAQALQAGAESERGAAATAGRIQAEQNIAQAGIRTDMGAQLLDLEKLTAQEESRLRDVGVGLDLATAQGAQMAARDAGEAAAAQTAQGFASATAAVAQGLEMVPLYQKTQAVKDFGKLQSSYETAAKNKTLGTQFLDAAGNPLPFGQAIERVPGFADRVKGLGALNAMEAQDFLVQQPQTIKDILKGGFGYNTAAMPTAPTINPMPSGGSKDLFSEGNNYYNPFELETNIPKFKSPYGVPYRKNAY